MRSNGSWSPLCSEYRSRTASLLAQILVKDELEFIRGEEDEKIQEALATGEILRPLQEITGHYSEVHLQDDQLILSDPYRSLPLEELSTGAQEQVLLALRLGFAARLLKKESLFLILDDAFQHADWDRRKNLLKEMTGLAKAGWQIIYLTMDDHIQKIFDMQGEKLFGQQYVSTVLPSS